MEITKIDKRKIFRLLLYIILCKSLILLALWYYDTDKSQSDYLTLEKEIVRTTIEDTTIDFDRLLAINPDTKGWIKIDALGISYPIMQSFDNEYYLHKNIYRQYSIAGSLFLDYRNDSFLDENTIIYGHNMKNGSMFGKLSDILEGRLGTNITILIYTKYKTYEYEVFSAYEIDPKDFQIDEDIYTLQNKSKIAFQKDIKPDDKYLTLYTCTDSSLGRIIIHAVLK